MSKETDEQKDLADSILNEFNIVWLRWMFLIIISPLYIFMLKRDINIYFILILVLGIIYNAINHINLNKKKYFLKWFDKNIYFDVLLVSGLVAADGGFSSSIYVCYYIFIIYEGIKKDIKHPLLLSLGVVAIYTGIVCGLYPVNQINITSLAFRDVFIIFAGILVSDVLNQFMIYDKLHKKEYDLARKDKLTGLYNKNSLEKILNEELLNAVKENRGLSVMMFDLDNFKAFNETYGHVTGDELLKYFAKVILETIAPSNLAFRYGGEEFLVILKDIQIQEAYKVAEAIRKRFSSSNIYAKTEEGQQRITVCCGLASCPEHSAGYYDLLEYLERALAEAKAEGKNKVVIAENE